MSAVQTLAAADQQAVLTEINAKQKANAKSTVKNFLIGAGFLTASAVLAVAFTPAAVVAGAASIVTGIYAAFKGWDLIGNIGRAAALDKARKEVTKDADVAPTSKRAASFNKWGNLVLTGTIGVLGVGLAVLVGGWVAPALLPAAFVQPVFSTLVGIGFATSTVHSFMDGVAGGATAISGFATKRQDAAQVPAAVVPPSAPAAVANVPSPVVSFEKAANGNAPAKPAAPEVAPVKQPEAPKV